MSAIPTRARELVRERQNGQCARCGSGYSEVHHRQRRREGGHAIEILVGLCTTDHRWAHANPKRAQELGFIVSVHETDVASVPIKTFMGWVRFTTDGKVVFVDDNEGGTDDSQH
ncbi:HNH endonuclease [Arthrobacter phage Tank]|uniref:HNH endonuclease n=2 Tax=Tankvirus tank TaxID=1982567 RepID=A0A0U4KS69_9CAUD|nr:HNH endonuclease [Arthrobacter phage Tank]ALY10600.1 HNH endonuclease [Arthrobacter phage Tank]ALY10850.1 HNH endonuclease [Arthrobacter phage Wilde]